jgi:hypothetical protein
MTETTALIQYDIACKALAKARSVDEVKDIRDKSDAMRHYARQAKNKDLEIDAAEIRIRAERRLGGMLLEQKDTVGMATGGGDTSGGTRKLPPQEPPSLADVGIDKKLSSRAQKLAAIPEETFEAMMGEWRERVSRENERVTVDLLKEKARREKDEQRESARQEAISRISEKAKNGLDEVCDIRHCSMQELLASGIHPDCIITDPPYPREYLHLYGELAKAAKDIPLVAVMCGQTYLFEIGKMMTEHLAYRWPLAYLTPGGQGVQQWERKIISFWKPVLVFGQALEWLGDVARSDVNDNDKRFHAWGQSVSGMEDLVERLSKPGELICDPFCGGGTTACVSLALGRRFVGCDIDAESVRTAKERCVLQMGGVCD